MSVVKIRNKDRLDKLIARLTLRIGRKPTQHEVVDESIRMAEERFEELLGRLTVVPVIDDEKYERILAISKELRDVPWITTGSEYAGKDDEDIYGT